MLVGDAAVHWTYPPHRISFEFECHIEHFYDSHAINDSKNIEA